MGRRRGAIAILIVCLAAAGCLSDLAEPAGLDGGGGAGSDSGGAGEDGGTVGPKCDPAGPFDEAEPLATTGGSINDGVEQAWPRVSRDGLTLYYVDAETRDGGRLLEGAVTHLGRAGGDATADFDMATAVAEEFTPSLNNDAPVLSPDNRRLYFSDGANKVYVSDRDGSEGLFPYPGEELAINATESRDVHPYLVGADTIYFTSSRDDDSSTKLYRSMAEEGGAFETAESVGLMTDTPHMQWAPVVSSDRRVIFFSADGALFRAVRQPNGDFDSGVLVEELDLGMSYPGSLSADDCVLYFHTDRRAGTDFDIWVARATVMF